MSLAPLLNTSIVVQLHAFAAIAALFLGLMQFARRKGTFCTGQSAGFGQC